jgi:hypothetical protein
LVELIIETRLDIGVNEYDNTNGELITLFIHVFKFEGWMGGGGPWNVLCIDEALLLKKFVEAWS